MLGLGREATAGTAPPTAAVPCAANASPGLPGGAEKAACKPPAPCAAVQQDTDRIRLDLFGAFRDLEPGLEGKKRLLRTLPFGLPAPAEVASHTNRTQALLDRQAPLVRVEAAEASPPRRASSRPVADAAHLSLWPLAPRIEAAIAEGVIDHQAIRLGLDATVRLSPAADALRRRGRRPPHPAQRHGSTQGTPHPTSEASICAGPHGPAISSDRGRSSPSKGYACCPGHPGSEPAGRGADAAEVVARGHRR